MKYLDGTTDITRTVHFGKPSAHEKACYTAVSTIYFSFYHVFSNFETHLIYLQVLKGHIALGTARFPNGTNGI